MKKDPVIILRKAFMTALLTIVVVILPLQVYISYEVVDSSQQGKLINQSGRQRMLSQRIAKNLIYIAHTENSAEWRAQLIQNIDSDFSSIQTTQALFVKTGLFNDKPELLTSSSSSIQVMYQTAKQVLAILQIKAGTPVETGQLEESLQHFLLEETRYIAVMEQATKFAQIRHEKEMKLFLWYSWGFTGLIFLSLIVVARKVLYPALQVVNQVFVQQNASKIHLEAAKKNAEINEQAMGEQAIFLLTSQQLYQAILNTTHAVIITINPQGCISVFNRAAETLFGYQRSEVEGENIKMLMPEPYKSSHDGYLEAYLSTGHKKIIDLEREVVGAKKDGSVFPLNLRVKEVRHQEHREFVGFIEDLSDKHEVSKAKKALDESQNLYLSVVDDQDNLICRYNKDFILTFVNRAYCEHLQKTRTQLLGHSLLDFLPEDVIDWVKLTHQDITVAQPILQHEDKIMQADASEEWQAWTTRGIFNKAGELIEFQGVGTITTSRKQSELDILQAQRIAEEANKSKSLFLSNMSHELRTPLNSILGFSQLLQLDVDEPLTAAQNESVDLIHKGGQHLLDLINEILDLSSIEAGKINLSVEVVVLTDVIEEIIPLVKEMAAKRGISIAVSYEIPTPIVVMADYMRTKQLLLNLLSNAIKYNHEKGQVAVLVGSIDKQIKVTIQDFGPGISRENQKLLFKPFSRLGAEKTAIEGTGIGLSLCKGIAEKMHGEIGVQSELGLGSQFWFTLPIANEHNALEINTYDPKEKINIAMTQIGLKVLYIEDNPANMQLMRKVIKRLEGCVLFDAPNAEIGLEMIAQIRPDVILMDIDLPGMNGFQAYEEIQKRFDFAIDLPIIAVSANAMKSDMERGKTLGFFEYLTKPLNIPLFIETLKKAVER